MNRILLLFAFIATMLPVFSSVQIGRLYYNLDTGTKTAEVTYMENSSSNSNYVSGTLSLPETVTFDGSTYSVTSIGDSAFYVCWGLTSVFIPNSVTSIGSSAFYNCNSLTSVIIPNSVTSIGKRAFYRCEDLTSVTIGNSVTSIGSDAFYCCYDLTSVTIPNSVTSIGERAFYNCSRLTSIEIPNSVSLIGESVFYNCSGLTSLTIPNSVSSIGESAFYNCSGLTSLTIPNSVTSIGKRAFYNCSGLTSVEIPNSVTSVGDDAFLGCPIETLNIDCPTINSGFRSNKALKTLAIGNSVTSIGQSAFSDCSGLTSVEIPNSVTEIGDYAFMGCSSLSSLTLEDGESPIKLGYNLYTSSSFDDGKGLFADCPLQNIYIGRNLSYNSGRGYGYSPFANIKTLTEVTIPNSVTSIGSYAFYNCSGLTSMEIPNSVTSIGFAAFYGCSGLTSVTIPDSVTSIGGYAFRGCSGLKSVTIPDSVTEIGDEAFLGCSSLNSLTLEDGKSSINFGYSNSNGNGQFRNCPLKNIYIGRNLSYNSNGDYGYSPFANIKTLTEVTISNSVTYIENYAFYNCSGLTSVEIPNSVTSIGNHAFMGCSSLSSLTLENGESPIKLGYNSYVSSVKGKGLFADCPLQNIYIGRNLSYESYSPFAYIITLTEVTIDGNVTSLPESLLYYCTGLTSLTIPNSVTSIGESAFFNCSGLISVEIPNSVTSIGSSAFYNCSGLTSVKIPNSVTSIGTYAFRGCSGMTSVTIPNSVISIGSYAFYYCSGLSSIIIPNSITTIERNTFDGCSGLTSVTIPNSVTSIGKEAFKGCPIETLNIDCPTIDSWFMSNKTLKTLTIGNSVTSIGQSAFSECRGLTSVTIGSSVAEIGNYAFNSCSSLRSLTLEDGESLIKLGYNSFAFSDTGKGLFADCSLQNIYIGRNLSYESDYHVGYSPFANIRTLTEVTISNSVTEIGESAFYNCSGLTSLTIPNSVTEIGSSAFRGCSGLTSVTIPNSVTSIGTYAFRGCSGLTSVTIPSSVTEIENEAFNGCSLTEIELFSTTPPSYYFPFSVFTNTATLVIPDNTLSSYLATDWKSFLKIEEENGDKAYVGNDDVFAYRFIESLHEAILVQDNSYKKMTNVSIPDRVVCDLYDTEEFYKVTSIGEGAFLNCNLMTNLKLPSGLVSINRSAFTLCSKLSNLNLPNSVTSIGEEAFAGCGALTRVDITDLEAWCKIDFDGSGANPLSNAQHLYLNGEEITDLTIPESVSSIKNYTFENCRGLTSVEIPNSVTSIGNGAFSWCSGLTSVTIPNSVTSIGSGAFSWCSGLTSVTIPNSVTSIGNSAFFNCSGLTSVTIGSSVAEIGSSAFSLCSGLTSVTIPNSVTSIGEYAFRDCSNMERLTFEDGMEDLTIDANNTFNAKILYVGRNLSGSYFCPDVKTLTIGGFATNISANYNTNKLTSVTINPGAEVVIEAGAFNQCSNLAELILPEDIAEIGANAFSGTSLKNVTVPGGVIADNAFANCNLDNIILGANVESIGEKAFDGNNAIQNVYATPATPPAAQNNTFSYYEAQLWVPEEAIDTYYNNTRCWYRFSGKPLVCPENIMVTGPASFNGKPGDTLQLSATITPANVTLDRVLWRSTNPAVATVDNNGLVTIHNFQSSDEAMTREVEESFCQIIASTLYEESPVAVVNIEALTTSIEYVNSEDMRAGSQGSFGQNDIFTLQGVCLKRQASQEDIDALTPGIYIIGGKKVVVK